MFDVERVKLGRRVLQVNSTPLAQQFAKKGIPTGLRGDTWAQILGVTTDDIVSNLKLSQFVWLISMPYSHKELMFKKSFCNSPKPTSGVGVYLSTTHLISYPKHEVENILMFEQSKIWSSKCMMLSTIIAYFFNKTIQIWCLVPEIRKT